VLSRVLQCHPHLVPLALAPPALTLLHDTVTAIVIAAGEGGGAREEDGFRLDSRGTGRCPGGMQGNLDSRAMIKGIYGGYIAYLCCQRGRRRCEMDARRKISWGGVGVVMGSGLLLVGGPKQSAAPNE